MMRLMILAILAATALGRKDYTGYKVFRFEPQDKEEIAFLQTLEDSVGKLDYWQNTRLLTRPIDIMVSPQQVELIKKITLDKGIKTSVMIEDMQPLIDDQRSRTSATSFRYDVFHSMTEIDTWIDDFSGENSDIVKVFTIGKTHEGRDIRGLNFSIGESTKPSAFFFGGIHAREWISPATMINFARMFVENYRSGDPEFASVIAYMNLLLIPVLNKDGYVYTWTDDRMWRKTRRHVEGEVCEGVDPNRNFDSNFGGPGASPRSCLDTYHGPYAFSEPETAAIRDFVFNLRDNGEGVELFIDFHAYSQLWMYSYGYTLNHCADHDLLTTTAGKAVNELTAVHGTAYEYGNIAEIIYEASGGSSDWAYDKAGIKHSYALELRDTGKYGFLLPESQILPTAEETYAGFMSVCKDVAGV